MCHSITYKLICEHVCTVTSYCSKGSNSQGRTCRKPSSEWVTHPAPAGYTEPSCPLAQCAFEAKGRLWNCCWCGCAWNKTGRCRCIMMIDRQHYRCEHICCPSCEAAGPYRC
ncbi:hypothetical protein CC79DRAFT_188502 [Sarocladium strictum]